VLKGWSGHLIFRLFTAFLFFDERERKIERSKREARGGGGGEASEASQPRMLSSLPFCVGVVES